jgi:hypothetical protein
MAILKISSRDLVAMFLDSEHGNTAGELHTLINERMTDDYGFRNHAGGEIISLPSILTALRYLDRDGKAISSKSTAPNGGKRPIVRILWYAA